MWGYFDFLMWGCGDFLCRKGKSKCRESFFFSEMVVHRHELQARANKGDVGIFYAKNGHYSFDYKVNALGVFIVLVVAPGIGAVAHCSALQFLHCLKERPEEAPFKQHAKLHCGAVTTSEKPEGAQIKKKKQ